ncbi:hypothetical protein AMJ47_00010 [Parcubacteria bacterium DG_72]|nr:MAG: hypothetical protein AMJ47_00010 [Parcubacteria bacterium DG_72]
MFKNNKSNKGNKKPAFWADFSEFRNGLFNNSALTSNYIIANAEIMSSPGPAGNRTPETLMSKQNIFIIS